MPIQILIQIGDNTNPDKQKDDACYKHLDIVGARFDTDSRTWSPGERERLVSIPDIEVDKLCVTYSCTKDELPVKLMESEFEEGMVNGKLTPIIRQRRRMQCNIEPSKDEILEVQDVNIVLKPSSVMG